MVSRRKSSIGRWFTELLISLAGGCRPMLEPAAERPSHRIVLALPSAARNLYWLSCQIKRPRSSRHMIQWTSVSLIRWPPHDAEPTFLALKKERRSCTANPFEVIELHVACHSRFA